MRAEKAGAKINGFGKKETFSQSNLLNSNELLQEAWGRALKILKPSKKELEHGLELHERLFTMDTFGFLPHHIWTEDLIKEWNELKDAYVGARELSKRMEIRRLTVMARDVKAAREFDAAVRSSGLNCMVQTVGGGRSREEDIKRMAAIQHVCRIFRNTLVHAGSVDEIKEAAKSGRVAVIWSVNGPPLPGEIQELEQEMSWIETWYNLGVRLMHMTYNRRNFIGDGCSEPADAGLSELGRDLIAKLNQTGIIVDVPHSGIRTTIEAAKTSSKPIMASHTGARAVFNHMRCKTDEALKAIADTDGLIGVFALNEMLGEKSDISTLLDHIDHVAKTAGVEHTAIGTDSYYHTAWPKGVTGYPKSGFSDRWRGNWNSSNHPVSPSDENLAGSLAWTNWPLYTVGLVTRGYSDDDIEKILGKNFLRVLDANRPEKELRSSEFAS